MDFGTYLKCRIKVSMRRRVTNSIMNLRVTLLIANALVETKQKTDRDKLTNL